MMEETSLQSFYFHSIRLNPEILEQIFQKGAIMPRNQLNTPTTRKVGFNGTSWISLCKYISPDYFFWEGERSAYHRLVKHSISIVLDDSIRAVKTHFCNYNLLTKEQYQHFILDTNEERFSDCIDEYQTKDPIDVSHFIAISYPITEMENMLPTKAKDDLIYLKQLLETYHRNLPILDATTDEFEKTLVKMKK